MEEETGGLRHISTIATSGEQQHEDEEENKLFNLDCINRHISLMKVIELQMLYRNMDIDPGNTDTATLNTSTSSKRHSGVIP